WMRALGRVSDLDLGLVALEQEGEPFLALAAIPALERDAQDIVGRVVEQPFGRFGQQPDGADRGLLVKLAIGGGQGVLPLVDAALGHLPGRGHFALVRALVGDAPGDEHLAFAVEQGHADAIAIGHGLPVDHGHTYGWLGLAARALKGTSTVRSSSRPWVHSARVAMEMGRAERVATALPSRAARASSASSSARMAAREGLASRTRLERRKGTWLARVSWGATERADEPSSR